MVLDVWYADVLLFPTAHPAYVSLGQELQTALRPRVVAGFHHIFQPGANGFDIDLQFATWAWRIFYTVSHVPFNMSS